MYEFVRGPLALVAFCIFFLGICYQIFLFFSLTKKSQPSVRIPMTEKAPKNQIEPSREVRKKARRKGTVLGMNPGMAVMTTIFHILLIICPIFLLAHNILIEDSWGFQPPSLTESITDIMTFIIMAFGIFFLSRRLFVPRVRAITSVSDYVLFIVVFAPFVTGFLAYHQFSDYKTMLILHILSGELMLVCIPFTRLVHMVYFFLNRIFIKSEYSFGPGKRIWKEVEA